MTTGRINQVSDSDSRRREVTAHRTPGPCDGEIQRTFGAFRSLPEPLESTSILPPPRGPRSLAEPRNGPVATTQHSAARAETSSRWSLGSRKQRVRSEESRTRRTATPLCSLGKGPKRVDGLAHYRSRTSRTPSPQGELNRVQALCSQGRDVRVTRFPSRTTQAPRMKGGASATCLFQRMVDIPVLLTTSRVISRNSVQGYPYLSRLFLSEGHS